MSHKIIRPYMKQDDLEVIARAIPMPKEPKAKPPEDKVSEPPAEPPAGGSRGMPLPAGTYSFMTHEMFEEFEKRRKADFPDADVLAELAYNSKLKLEKGQVTGSNPFIVCLANMILPEGFRTATQADLERALKQGFPLRYHYEDTTGVLRDRQEPNSYLAKDLYKRFKKVGITLKEGVPYVVPYCGLKLVKDSKSPHKLAFELTDRLIDENFYFEAPILNELSQQKFETSDIDEAIGLPKKVGKNGARTLWTRNHSGYAIKNSGFSRLCLDWSLDVDADDVDLANSDSGGRVVVVSAEGARKIF